MSDSHHPTTRFAFACAIAFSLLAGTVSGNAQAEAPAMTALADMPAGKYSMDKTHASLLWKVSHAGLSNYTARFKRFDATIALDPKQPENSTVIATIDPLSLETDYVTGERDFNKELSTGEQWLNATKFPEIRFESTRLQKTGDNTGIMHGNLSFLGVTKPVALDVVFNGAYAVQPFSKKPTLGFSATGSLNRSDWGLDTYIPAIGDRVDFVIEAEFARDADTAKTAQK